MKEEELQEEVRKLSALLGFKYYHTYSSRNSESGFPDVVLVKPPRVIFAELKSERGTVTPKQQEWLTALSACGGVEVYLWRPQDMEEIGDVMRRA